MASDNQDFFLDKKWKPPKRVLESTTSKTSSSLSRSSSMKGSSSKGQYLPRSFSQKNTPSIPKPSSSSSSSLSRSSSITRPSSPPLRRSKSMKTAVSPPKSPTVMRSLSQRSTEFTRKCTTLAKEQRARFYIMKRCVAMLVCWRKEDDS